MRKANRFIRDEVPKCWTPSPEAGSIHDDQPTSGIITVSKYLIHGQLGETRVGIKYWPVSCLIAVRRSIA
jgi:hypothetical protein